MRATRAIELGTGLFVLLGFAALFFLVTQITNREIGFGDGGYRLTAGFEQIESIGYDFTDYRAKVVLRIDGYYDRIPQDSDASIFTAGLLGGQYVGIGPGGSETFFKDGDQIEFTQSAIVLESLISKFLFSKAAEQGAAVSTEGAK
jgi:phospholipid/cholesterol/gamma-HCH transport system substrate-binding protein